MKGKFKLEDAISEASSLTKKYNKRYAVIIESEETYSIVGIKHAIELYEHQGTKIIYMTTLKNVH